MRGQSNKIHLIMLKIYHNINSWRNVASIKNKHYTSLQQPTPIELAQNFDWLLRNYLNCMKNSDHQLWIMRSKIPKNDDYKRKK